MPFSHTSHASARNAVHALGIVVGVLISLAAAVMIAQVRDFAVRNAELHLDNYTVVLAEHTRLALRAAPADVVAAMTGQGEHARRADDVHEFFANLYGDLDFAYAGRAIVMRRDGTLVTTVPRRDELAGRNYAGHALFSRVAKGGASGTIDGPGLVESDRRLIAYRHVAGFPLLVVVSTPMSEVLADWRRDALIIAAGALLLGALGGAAAFFLGRQLRVTERLSEHVAESEKRLNSIINSAMDAIITVDERQDVVLFNAAAEKIFGCRAAEAVGGPLERFIPPRYRSGHGELVRRFGEVDVTMRRMGGNLVLSGLRATGEEFPIDASISHTTVEGHKFYTVILRDVTERQRAQEEQRRTERELKESESRLQSIIASAMDAIITLDEQQNIVLFNAAAEKTFGCDAADAIGTPVDRFIPERYRRAHREHVRRFGEAGVTMRRMGGNLVLAGLKTNGEEFPLDASISQVTVSGQKFYTVILRDISERERASEAINRSNRELRELYESMHQVREAERTRIARELHDELAQWLTALKMDAAWIATRLPPEHVQLVGKAERMKAVVDDTVAAVRRIAADLRPVMLDDLGLVPALESLLNDLSERAGIEVKLEGAGDELALEDPLATAVYRMVQEALTNVARHAHATSVTVEVGSSEERLRVQVRDDGQGLKPDPSRKSFGVLGIRERARTLGGDARIYSPAEGGTVVEIEIPLSGQPVSGAPT